jgi:outer membrane receptor protein involved in Fe transport
MEDWLNVDLLTSYELRFGGIGLEIEARVNNLFDEQVELQVDNRYILNRPLVVGRPDLSPSISQPSNNPAFGQPIQLSDPRAVVLSAIVRF